MKISLILFTIIAVLAGTLLIINAGSTERRLAEKMNVPIIAADSSDTFANFTAVCERSIAENEKLLNAFKENLEESGPKALKLYRKDAERLEQRNIELRARLQEVKMKQPFDWKHLSVRLRYDLDSLKIAVAIAVKKNGPKL